MHEPTPMMQQYQEIKQRHAGCLLFFRMGDFYEMFYEDAVEAAPILGIALTSRQKRNAERIPMCGVPYHAAESYLAKLLAAGRSVAICEQVEDARKATGLVRRDVVRVVTPGTATSAALLETDANNFLVSIAPGAAQLGLAAADLSTGEFILSEFCGADCAARLQDELVRLKARELLLPRERASEALAARLIAELGCVATERDGWLFERANGERLLCEHFSVASLDGFGCAEADAAVGAAGALLAFLQETQRGRIGNLRPPVLQRSGEWLHLDATTQRNLELVQSWAGGGRQGTLLSVLDRTLTPMGARLLRNWLLRPLQDAEAIGRRLAAVGELVDALPAREQLRTDLKEIGDVERSISRLTLGTAAPRDLIAVKRALQTMPALESCVRKLQAPLYTEMASAWDNVGEIAALIDQTLVDDPAAVVREGGLIKPGFDDELDELRSLSSTNKAWIAKLEQRERQRTGIANLRVGFNKVFGYYIEVTKAQQHLAPPDYQRKQTLVNAERYVTPELKTYEEKVLSAQERANDLEYDLFIQLQEQVAAEVTRVQGAAATIARIDALASLAEVAHRNRYVSPVITGDTALRIVAGRHPVLEQMPGVDRFVPNDCFLDGQERQIAIITGPNMAGKSTYMRQVALIVLLAHMGGFVPAEQAEIGLVDRIFTRVGAQDNLVRGQSTFLLEMQETANIMRNATARSFVILDEIGRGTSTFDGVSIAWSVAEYLHEAPHLGCKTLFATHYFELTELAARFDRIYNANVTVREWNDEIIFLYHIVDGATDRSYGIQVGRLAGLPDSVVQRAKQRLAELEQDAWNRLEQLPTSVTPAGAALSQLQLFHSAREHPVVQRLRDLAVEQTTPVEALTLLHELQQLARQP